MNLCHTLVCCLISFVYILVCLKCVLLLSGSRITDATPSPIAYLVTTEYKINEDNFNRLKHSTSILFQNKKKESLDFLVIKEKYGANSGLNLYSAKFFFQHMFLYYTTIQKQYSNSLSKFQLLTIRIKAEK